MPRIFMDLLSLAASHGVEVPESIRDAGALTRYAVDARYPGLSEDLSLADWERSVELAERVVAWATERIETDRPA